MSPMVVNEEKKRMIVTDKSGEILVSCIFRTLNDTLVYCGIYWDDNGNIQERDIREKDVLSIREKL